MEEYNMADESLQNPVIDAVAHMVNLKTYEMTLTPLTSNILKTMDDTGVKLSDLFLFMVEEDDLDAQLKNLKLSKQREYISGLSIE
jgi:radical SAM superfamily enzyme